MPWAEHKPASSDNLSELPSVLTANAIILRQGIEKHSFWTEASGASAGIPRLSLNSFGPGAARAFYDVESNVSVGVATTKPTAGRLYVSSDNSRFWGLTSANTVPLGSRRAQVYLTPTVNSNERLLVQIGSAAVGGSTTTIGFTTSYAVAPVVEVQSLSSSIGSLTYAAVVSSSTTFFTARVYNVWGAANVNQTVLWKSMGTVVL